MAQSGRRASFASDPAQSRGRRVPEADSPIRTAFQRDRDRIIHSTAFRRLKHKTQVFVAPEGDHFRTRLTHTLEVAQIARTLARALHLDEDLAEALALAHDLGHTPFGHTGEEALDACLLPFGGFDHNAQSLRLVTALERRYAAFDGLNLTFETLEGLIKHNGPLLDTAGRPCGAYAQKGLPQALLLYEGWQELDLARWPGLEAQCAAIADDIAYNAHDLEDGLRAQLFGFEALEAVPFLKDKLSALHAAYPHLEPARAIHELTRYLIRILVEDVLRQARQNFAQTGVATLEDVQNAGRVLVTFSPEMRSLDVEIKAFLFKHLYRHASVVRVRGAADKIVCDLYSHYCAHPETLPPNWRPTGNDPVPAARQIGDYIAGMTDRFALEEHKRFFDSTPPLR